MWPFASIMSTVILSNVDEALSSEGYEFGGYLFFPEEMKAFGQFKGSKLQRYDSKPLLGIKNGNSAFSSKANSKSKVISSSLRRIVVALFIVA